MDETPPLPKLNDNRRVDWKETRLKLELAFVDLLLENQSWPTNAELEEKTGLCRATIQVHAKELKKEKFQNKFDDLKILTRSVVIAVAKRAIKNGDPRCAELYLKIVEGWSPSLKVEIEGKLISGFSTEELLEQKKKMEYLFNDSRLLNFTRRKHT